MFLCKSLPKFCGSAGNILDTVSTSSAFNIANSFSSPFGNSFQQQQRNVHVTILGSAGGVGAPLSMMLKQSPQVSKIKCYDIKPHTLGIAKDCSHIEGRAKLTGYKGSKDLPKALSGAQIVVMCACANGWPKKPENRNDFFKKNSCLAKNLAKQIAITCPNAIILVITNPINAIVPLIGEVLKEHHVFNPKKLIGMTILDTVRANRFAAAAINCNPLDVNVPVIGGHSEETTIPVFSQAKPKVKLDHDKWLKLVHRVKCANTELTKARNIDTNPVKYTLAMAYSAARFVTSLSLARCGKKNIVEPAYVRSDVCKDVKYFASPCVLGRKGIEKILGIPKLNHCEEEWLKHCLSALKKDIKMGLDFDKKKHGKKHHDKKHNKCKKQHHGKKHHGKKDHGKKGRCGKQDKKDHKKDHHKKHGKKEKCLDHTPCNKKCK